MEIEVHRSKLERLRLEGTPALPPDQVASHGLEVAFVCILADQGASAGQGTRELGQCLWYIGQVVHDPHHDHSVAGSIDERQVVHIAAHEEEALVPAQSLLSFLQHGPSGVEQDDLAVAVVQISHSAEPGSDLGQPGSRGREQPPQGDPLRPVLVVSPLAPELGAVAASFVITDVLRSGHGNVYSLLCSSDQDATGFHVKRGRCGACMFHVKRASWCSVRCGFGAVHAGASPFRPIQHIFSGPV